MTPERSARIGGFVLGALVMSVGLVLSLEIGAWSHALVTGTLSAVMADHGTRMSNARLETLVAQLRRAPETALRIEAAGRLGQSRDPRAVTALTSALRDRDPGVQRAAALALGEIRDTTAVPALIDLLKTSRDTGVRNSAAFALGVIRNRRAVDALSAAAKRPRPEGESER